MSVYICEGCDIGHTQGRTEKEPPRGIFSTPHPMTLFLIALFLAFYATRTFYTVDMYKDEYLITEIATIEDPNAWWAWHCKAMKRFDNQSFREALTFWVMAKMISPREFKLYVNIAVCMCLMGNKPEGDSYIEKAEKNIVPGQEKEALEIIKAYKEGKLPILL